MQHRPTLSSLPPSRAARVPLENLTAGVVEAEGHLNPGDTLSDCSRSEGLTRYCQKASSNRYPQNKDNARWQNTDAVLHYKKSNYYV